MKMFTCCSYEKTSISTKDLFNFFTTLPEIFFAEVTLGGDATLIECRVTPVKKSVERLRCWLLRFIVSVM